MSQKSRLCCAAAATESHTSKGGKKGKKGGGKEVKANTSVSSGIKLENVRCSLRHAAQQEHAATHCCGPASRPIASLAAQ